MAHFAELDENNVVLRVVVACNQDIANNGGELSEQAAEHFKNVVSLSINGVKWVQTSYNNNFRKKFAAVNSTYDPIKDKFIDKQPYSSWYLNENDDWTSPVSRPKDNNKYLWDEQNQSWNLL